MTDTMNSTENGARVREPEHVEGAGPYLRGHNIHRGWELINRGRHWWTWQATCNEHIRVAVPGIANSSHNPREEDRGALYVYSPQGLGIEDMLVVNRDGTVVQSRGHWRQDGARYTSEAGVIVDVHAYMRGYRRGQISVDVWPRDGGEMLTIGLNRFEDAVDRMEAVPVDPSEGVVSPDQVRVSEDMMVESDWDLLNRLLLEEAQHRGWCSEFEQFVAKFNRESTQAKLAARERTYNGTLRVTFDFVANRNGTARQGMLAVEQAVAELLTKFPTLNNIALDSESEPVIEMPD